MSNLLSASTLEPHLIRKLDQIVAKWRASNHEPSPLLLHLYRNSANIDVLRRIIQNHIALITRRSQDAADGEISLYDRALVEIGQNGLGIGSEVQDFYLTEFLGANISCSVNQQVASDYMQFNLELDNAFGLGDSDSVTGAASALIDPSVGADAPATQGAPGRPGSPCHGVSIQPNINRLIIRFRQAKNDFYRRSESNTDTESSVRFLRDTAENALQYLRANGRPNHSLIPDIEYHFRLARDRAAQLSGGRQRRFEDPSRGPGIPYRGPRREDSRRFVGDPTPRPRVYEAPRGGDPGRPFEEPSNGNSDNPEGSVSLPHKRKRPIDSYRPSRDN
ncbi:uncharacterized protein BO97DRAFT_403989 [Aspergillus homomorphus CBS 101889]|uniref:Uncharacterized protein n=1 Tax=Aspergillus homomorphus (strain CBS 101889) TaxID=1450537 RepID=A0A395I4F5_ASPHC|nr:hypothetical protein BO97DRAFT_403989 [Aspergillus homomorphus CBS 101889]RAL14970.1 hypothetical protein BO97DRAFT_403989 [Aspergillus homomorphus CBS 101889]